ncbi:MAG: helix-turn-helix transcriptional regulator [Bifidobacterium sp.]|uniref:helix-turn-helix domain-containing protein n=1 Tax=Bifidobacterium sp. TaxID=41200 RepID=UPI0039EC4346
MVTENTVLNRTELTQSGESYELKPVSLPQRGNARVRNLTPAQKRAVMFAQQQVLRARAAKKAKDDRQAALNRMWMQDEDAPEAKRSTKISADDSQDNVQNVSLREAIGHVLRDLRTKDHKTLREVSENAGVSLGYLSEVERGQKEASSELLSSIAEALGVSVPQMLRMVADYLESLEN